MKDLFPQTITTVTLEDMCKEAERELALRRRVYPGWVAAGRLKQAQADRQIAIMEAIAANLWKQLREGAG